MHKDNLKGKYCKILIFNFVIVCLLAIVTEFICAFFLYVEFYGTSQRSLIQHANAFCHYYYTQAFYNKESFMPNDFRTPAGLEYIKSVSGKTQNSDASPLYRPKIVLLGCSFAYGQYLENNDAFHSVLSNAVHRTVFNLGISGGSPREMLYILRNDKIRNKLLRNNNDVEYVIYTYIFDHKKRLFVNHYAGVPNFTVKESSNTKHLEYIKPIYKSFAYTYFRVYSKFLEKKLAELFYLYMDEIHTEIEKHFSYDGKPAKFVILIYEDDGKIDWEKIRKNGIIVIKLSDISDAIDNPEYRFPDSHPNAKAWHKIVPALVKELNLSAEKF